MPYSDPEARRAYHVNNAERARERVRKWRKANPEKVRAQNAAKLQRDPEANVRRGREWRQNNLEKVQAYQRERVRTPDERRAWKLRRDARIKERRDADTFAYVKILVCDPCSYCGQPAPAPDHIVPVFENGDDHWTNLTACCTRCNSSKNATGLLLWLARRLS